MIRRVLEAMVLAGLTAGCSNPPQFEALTTPPPLTQAALCDKCDEGGGGTTITLTKGVALAFQCLDGETGAPCAGLQGTIADPTVAQVFDGYLDTLAPATTNLDDTGIDGATAEGVLVVVGTKVGGTSLSCTSTSGDVVFAVSVVAP